MATLRDTSALNALNEQEYINKLYENNDNSIKKLLKENYTDNTGVLNTEQNRVQQQTGENLNRTNVEATKMQNAYKPNVSAGAGAQAALSRGNAAQGNATTLRQAQSDADTEIERQRQLLASQYSTAIKQAQADNDMERAQQLYEAAKEEEAKLLSLRQSASTMLAEKGDTSIRDSLLAGETPAADYNGETWGQVLKNEAQINEIYDNQLESKLLGLQSENEEALSDLAAKQAAETANTDKNLTQTYVDAMKQAKNYAEVQAAYGQGSGTAAAARLAQDVELQNALTGLRRTQMGADAAYGMNRFDIEKAYRDQLAKQTAGINQQRAEALYKAANDEEQSLLDTQTQIGNELALENDYSVLGRLYGLTQDQIDRLQGTGAYAPVYSEEPTRNGGTPIRSVLQELYGGNYDAITGTVANAEQFKQNIQNAAAQEADRKKYEDELDTLVTAMREAARAQKKK
jgi:hypothetical protein